MDLGVKLFRRCLFLICVLSGGAFAADEAKPYKICIDANFWGPYTFVLEGEAAGLHVELARAAFSQLGLSVEMRIWPWRRCLAYGKSGKYDAILSASYNAERATFLHYPTGAKIHRENGTRSPLRVTQAEYIVVVRSDDVFEWDGQEQTIPAPVGLPIGYAEVATLQGYGIRVSQATSYGDLFKMLARGRVNSIVLPRPTADMYFESETFEVPLGVLPVPLRSTSYFLVVSKEGRINATLAQSLWEGIAAQRENEAKMIEFRATVKKALERCFDPGVVCNY